ncbi:DUF1116 domain-containing protein [Undibacterium arcticum]|uniref:DUF1116 domain-containing protein n=1 Tax=Undibacterium arcticum TaxID=1762892 RepID=A0ABV7EWX7_9BURK
MQNASPDADAIGRMLAVRPMLCGVARASDVLPLAGRTLLHAGPPIAAASTLPRPQRNSAVMAILYEGWASSVEMANHLLDSGAVCLKPAQDCRAAIPLADILSPSMAVLVVHDAQAPWRCGYSTINGGDGPVMRVGLCSDAVLERLRWINTVLAPQLAPLLDGAEIDLIALADRALQQGDDCHGRTIAGSALLLERLRQSAAADNMSAEVVAFLDRAPAFFLNVWMAAVKCVLRAAEGVAGSGVVTAIGGNGHSFGIQIAAAPGCWFVTPATPPLVPGAGPLLQERALGAIGDSAIIDAFGGGAMAASHAPTTRARLDAVCGEHALQFPTALLQTSHPAFVHIGGLCTGLTVRRTQAMSQTPVISLGVLDRQGEQGRLDGGFYFAPRAPFEQAWHTLEDSNEPT